MVEAKVQAETSAAAAVLGELESHLKALREAAAQEEAKVAAEVAAPGHSHSEWVAWVVPHICIIVYIY